MISEWAESGMLLVSILQHMMAIMPVVAVLCQLHFREFGKF